MTEPYKPILFKSFGERRVIVEVPPPPKAPRRMVKHHIHTVKWDRKEHQTPHAHVVDLDAPEHIHGVEPDGAA